MASVYFDKSRKAWRLSVTIRGKRRTLWLGPITKAGALAICRHVELLLAAAECGVQPPDATRSWCLAIAPRISKALRDWGLIEHAAPDLPNTLGSWIDHYITSRTDVEESTRDRYRTARNHLCDYLGSDTPLQNLTQTDAEAFAARLRESQAATTASKYIKTAKMFINAAVKSRLLAVNPFADLYVGGKRDKDRDHYVDMRTVDLLIETNRQPLWKLIFALTRIAGFRCPSEILALQWSDIDWQQGVIALDSPKTGLRRLPIFKSVRPYLEDLPQTGGYVCHKYRNSDASAFTRHLEITCRNAGVLCWPKPWVNMRASARTDMEAEYPVATCDLWMGHSTKVAREHYARVSNDDWLRATGIVPEQRILRLRKDA